MNTTFVTFETADSLLLQGVWTGSKHAKTVYIFIHGLNSNLFSLAAAAELLSKKKNSAVLVFNNRGYGFVSKVRQKHGGVVRSQVLGGAHEVFTDSRHDIAAAVSCAKSRGAKRIILVGHSTGTQKSIWYLAHKPDDVVVGAVLLAPLSDYAGKKKEMGERAYIQAEKIARAYVAKGKPHQLMPSTTSSVPCDAQRWLSLYTPESKEQIFPYSHDARPVFVEKVRVPLAAFFSEGDQYADRPVQELVKWFSCVRSKIPIETEIIHAHDHAFSGYEKKIFEHILKVTRTW